MQPTDVLVELSRRGVEITVAGNRLRFRPKEAVSDELRSEIVEHKPDLIRLLAEDEHAVAWRVEFMRTQVPPRGAVPFLVARPILSDVRGLCLSCDAPLSDGATVRCTLCVRAAERVLNELREDVRSSATR